MWPDSDADRARSNLKATISRLRGRLGDSALIAATQNGYALAAERDIDIAKFLNGDGSSVVVDSASLGQLELGSNIFLSLALGQTIRGPIGRD